MDKSTLRPTGYSSLFLSCGLFLFIIAKASAKLPFNGKSFSVRSEMITFDQHTTSFSFEESYSREQQKAVIKVKTQKTDNPAREKLSLGDYYIDAPRRTAVLANGTDSSCKTLSISTVDSLIDVGLPVDRAPDEEFIVGPAKILLFLQANRAQFKPQPKWTYKVRNHDCTAYSFAYTPRFAKPVTFSIFYSKEPTGAGQPLESFPLQVSVDQEGSSTKVIEFYELAIRDAGSGPLDELLAGSSIREDDIVLDEFTIPPDVGCSSALQNKAERLLEPIGSALGSFSFRAQVESSNPALDYELFVAYETKLSSMLIEMHNVDVIVRRINNLNINRLYQIIVDRRSDLPKLNGNKEVILGSDKLSACVTSKLFPDDKFSHQVPSFSQLLAGAELFALLGSARVREIKAKVYETRSTRPPFWLDQSVAYKDGKSSGAVRFQEPGRPQTDGSVQQDTWNTVLYLADDNSTYPRLLMAEIYRLVGAEAKKIDRRVVRFFDFSWNLDLQNPSGTPADEYFSLQDFCSTGEQQYAKVSLLLEGERLFEGDESRRARSVNVLAGMQDLFRVPITMVHDLETKVINEQNKKDSQKIVATLRVADHGSDLSQLEFLGRGKLSGKGNRESAHTVSFMECYLAAAHRKEPVKFAFVSADSHCLIERRLDEGGFSMHADGAFEIYLVTHVADDDEAIKASSFRRLAHDGNQMSHFMEKILMHNEVTHKAALFALRDIHIARLDHKQYTHLSQHGAGVTRVTGFGLSPMGNGNRQLGAKSVNWDRWSPIRSADQDDASEMSLAQCQAACLSDAKCHSYSICIEEIEIQCVLSTADLRRTNLAYQLDNSAAKLGEEISINLSDNQTVSLIKRKTCDVYSKIFVDLFKMPLQVEQSLAGRITTIVESVEDCAELCATSTFEALRGDAISIKNKIPYLGLTTDVDENSLRESWASHQNVERSICKDFIYLKYLQFMKLQRVDREKILRQAEVEDESSNVLGDFCFMEPSNDSSQVHQVVHANSDLYSFKFDLFYERSFGVSLRGSKVSDDLVGVYLKAKNHISGTQDEADAFSKLVSLVERGDNFQTVLMHEAQTCAELCFTQRSDTWPACRSFSITVVRLEERAQVICRLNSITLKQAINSERFDLIDSDTPNTWHYDPRAGFSLEESKFAGSLELALEELDAYRNIPTMKLHTIVVLFLVAIGVAAGTLVGITLKPIVMARIVPDPVLTPYTRDDMVQQPVLEFKNQVKYDRTIPD